MSGPLRGVRFAPSPTGRFHVGNLRTAWISHRLARELGEPWIVRFEDIDRPRVVPGAQELQLQDLVDLGMVPDRIEVQSHFLERHQRLFDRAVAQGQVYPCSCSRKDVQQALAEAASAPHHTVPAYSGACRPQAGADVKTQAGKESSEGALAWRFRMPDESGRDDFIVARTGPTGFVPAYHWACALDDAEGAYLWLVRAADLAEALIPQQAVQRWALREQDRPVELASVFHTALVVQDDGHRLEKRTRGVTWPELRERHDAASLLGLFEKSWKVRPPALFEEPRRLTLGELGI